MLREPTSDMDRLTYREPSAVGGVIGLIFLIGFVSIFLFGGRGLLQWPQSFAEVLFMGVFLLLVMAILIRFVLQLVRIGATIDRRLRTVTTRWGLLRPTFSKTRPLASFDHLQITSAGLGSGRRGYLLVIAGASRTAVIGCESDYSAIVRLADEIAQFLGFDVRL